MEYCKNLSPEGLNLPSKPKQLGQFSNISIGSLVKKIVGDNDGCLSFCLLQIILLEHLETPVEITALS